MHSVNSFQHNFDRLSKEDCSPSGMSRSFPQVPPWIRNVTRLGVRLILFWSCWAPIISLRRLMMIRKCAWLSNEIALIKHWLFTFWYVHVIGSRRRLVIYSACHAEELNVRYYIPQNIGQVWIAGNQIFPLLDGLDEVAETARVACIYIADTHWYSWWCLSYTLDCEPTCKKRHLQNTPSPPLTGDEVGYYDISIPTSCSSYEQTPNLLQLKSIFCVWFFAFR